MSRGIELPETTVLVADDESSIRNLIADVCATILSGKVRIIQASSAPQAIHHLQTVPTIDLVCTDLEMPRAEDGNLVAKTALGMGKAVIVCSCTPEKLAKDVKAGVSEVFSKPFSSIRDFRLRVESLLLDQI